MPLRSKNTGSLRRAFTLLEVLVVLAILIGVSAIVLPGILNHGLGDLRSDTQIRIQASLLDAQREARRTGQTMELLLSTAPGTADSKLILQRMPDTTQNSDSDSFGSAFEDQDTGFASTTTQNQQTDPEEEGEESDRSIALAYAMPDGTLFGAVSVPQFEIDGKLYNLVIDPANIRANFELADAELVPETEPDENQTILSGDSPRSDPEAQEDLATDDSDGAP